MLTNCTVAYNQASSGGGIGAPTDVHFSPQIPTYLIANSIIALNTDPNGADDIAGRFVTPTYFYSDVITFTPDASDLVGADESGHFINGMNGNLVGVANPGIGPLAGNGGPTPTIALLPDSPAIDGGSNTLANDPTIGLPLSTDQRGAFRGAAGLNAGSTVDIGAYEASSSYLVTSTADTGDVGTLSAANAWANVSTNVHPANLSNPTSNTLVFNLPTLAATPAQAQSNLRSVVSAVQDVPEGTTPPSIVLQPTTPDQVASVVAAINNLAPATGTNPPTVTVTLDLGSQNVTTTTLAVPTGVQLDLTSTSGTATVRGATVTGGTVYVDASVSPSNWTVTGGNVTFQGPTAGDLIVTGGTVTLDDGTVITGNSPAIIVNGGTVILEGVTAQTATNSPTIVVNGGSLIVRNSMIQESTGYAQAAILITGGTVDLGTTASPGGNTFNVNGAGELVHNASGNLVSAIGDTFTINGVPLASSSLSGVVFSDFNNDGQVDFGEQGIAGVTIKVDGTDFLGNQVHLSQTSDGDGAYVFLNLRPGHYTIAETQPAGYTQGINTVGTGGGTVSFDQFDLYLAAGLNALNYNYGERPVATGAVHSGQTAGIGFWNNKNGQALIKALNSGPTSTQLGHWLAATFPHMFGAPLGNNSLSGKSNAEVASFFQSQFVVKDQKLDAQILATALAVYVTDPALDTTGVGAQYGFIVGGCGVGTSTFNVGANGAAFGVANNTTMTVMDLLLAADAQSVNGLLYNGNSAKRTMANSVFSAINQVGGI